MLFAAGPESELDFIRPWESSGMARGYSTEDLKERLVGLLQDNRIGLSGVEISDRLGVSRVTMAKYLEVFAAEGLLNYRSIGNITLWFVDEGVEQYRFPDDYFRAQKRFSELLASFSQRQVHALVRNCLHSGASVARMATEVILPSAGVIADMFDRGKIGVAEAALLRNTVSGSIRMMGAPHRDVDPSRNVIVIAADPRSGLTAEAASASYRSQGWSVFELGDMSSSAADIMLDLDLQKLLSKVWKKRSGVMIVAVFSDSAEGLGFFAGAVEAVREKYGGRLLSAMSGPADEKTAAGADLVSGDLDAILQWSRDVLERGAAETGQAADRSP